MLATSILYGSVVCTLFAPLMVALLVGSSFFFNRELSAFERTTYRLVRFSSMFSFLASILAFGTLWFAHSEHGSISIANFHISSSLNINFRLFFTWRNLAFLTSCTTISTVITFFSHLALCCRQFSLYWRNRSHSPT